MVSELEQRERFHGMTVRWHWLKHSSAARRITTTASRGSDCDQRHTDCAGRKPCRMATIRGLQNRIRSFRMSFWHASIVHPFFKLLVVVVSSKIRESFWHDSRYFQDFPVNYFHFRPLAFWRKHEQTFLSTMTPHDPAEVRTWLHGLGLEEAPERAMAPSGGAQLLQVWMMGHWQLFFLTLSRWLGKNDFGTIIPFFFLVGSFFFKDRGMIFFSLGRGNGWCVPWAVAFSFPKISRVRLNQKSWCRVGRLGIERDYVQSWDVMSRRNWNSDCYLKSSERNIDSQNYELFIPKNLNFQSLHGMATSAPLALRLTRGAGEQQPIRADCLEVDSGSCAPSFGRCLHQSSNWSEMKIPSFSFSQRLPFSIFFVPALLIYANDQMYVLCLFPVVPYKHSFDMLPCSRMYSWLST